jgi:hypothetical protein
VPLELGFGRVFVASVRRQRYIASSIGSTSSPAMAASGGAISAAAASRSPHSMAARMNSCSLRGSS